MTGWGSASLHGGTDGGEPQQPTTPPPVQGGWQQAWQDEYGQVHYPYAAQQQPVAPPYDPTQQHVDVTYVPAAAMPPAPAPAPAPAPTEPTFVAPEELAPVGPQQYFAPARATMDPSQRTMAAVITFVALLIGLWGILGFLGSMSTTLSSVAAGNEQLKAKMKTANAGLESLDGKTGHLPEMADSSEKLAGLLGGIDSDMGAMLAGVSKIADGMEKMDTSLAALDTEMGAVDEVNTRMGEQLKGISGGLDSQVASVRSMRRDVQRTGVVLKSMPGRLRATNARLAHVNKAVNIMGCKGIASNLQVKLSLGPPSIGSATVFATIVPPGAWGTQDDGVTPC